MFSLKTWRIIQALYLVSMSGFIFYALTVYQPAKVHAQCVESSAKIVKDTSPQDAYETYFRNYDNCAKKYKFLLSDR